MVNLFANDAQLTLSSNEIAMSVTFNRNGKLSKFEGPGGKISNLLVQKLMAKYDVLESFLDPVEEPVEGADASKLIFKSKCKGHGAIIYFVFQPMDQFAPGRDLTFEVRKINACGCDVFFNFDGDSQRVQGKDSIASHRSFQQGLIRGFPQRSQSVQGQVSTPSVYQSNIRGTHPTSSVPPNVNDQHIHFEEEIARLKEQNVASTERIAVLEEALRKGKEYHLIANSAAQKAATHIAEATEALRAQAGFFPALTNNEKELAQLKAKLEQSQHEKREMAKAIQGYQTNEAKLMQKNAELEKKISGNNNVLN